ncbi:hypothetical protein FS837_010897 [Tulasnella sp. UAMH 9824]|nr:hypothetical protein FS837_010897 [Tulasnella sp. UAMH 9824]
MANPNPSRPFSYRIGGYVPRTEWPRPNCLACRRNVVRHDRVLRGTAKAPCAAVIRLANNTLRDKLLPMQKLTPDNVSWILQIHLETTMWSTLPSPFPVEAPAVLSIHKDTLIFSHTGKSGWFVVPESQHVFSNGRIVELVAFGNADGDAVEATSDPGYDYIGTISTRGLHDSPLKGKSLSEVLPEEYLGFPDEAQRTLGDVKECFWLGFAVVELNPAIKHTFGSESTPTDIRCLATPSPVPSALSLEQPPNIPPLVQPPASFPSTSTEKKPRGLRAKFSLRPIYLLSLPDTRSQMGRWIGLAGSSGTTNTKPQCPFHPQTGIAIAETQQVVDAGDAQAQAAKDEEPTTVGRSTVTSSNEAKHTDDDMSDTVSLFPLASPLSPFTGTSPPPKFSRTSRPESTSSTLSGPHPPDFTEYAIPSTEWKLKPGLNIFPTSRQSTRLPPAAGVTSPRVTSSQTSEATSGRADLSPKSHSNTSDTPINERKRKRSTENLAS